MKIYIHTDLEGISGINNHEMVEKNAPGYDEAVRYLMSDLNAAVDGSFQGGATHVTVLDSHGGGGNFKLELLDKRADVDIRTNKMWWGKLDSSYSGTFFIGAHAMAGTMNGFLDHTQSSEEWYNYYINGRRAGELAQWAMVAANFNVPMLLVTGDEAACTEARQFFDPVECVPVKRGNGRNKALIKNPVETAEMIRQSAMKAISLVGSVKPFTPILPMEIKLELTRADYCDRISAHPGVERIDARTVRKVTSSYLDVLFQENI